VTGTACEEVRVRRTDGAIERIRDLIRSGELPPASRLPPEQKLAEQLGLSRNSLREAVKALELVRVLDSRPGDGTYVTSLAPRLLLEGFSSAIDLLQDETLLEIVEIRLMLEPVATAAATPRITSDHLATLADLLAKMRATAQDTERMVHYDIEFHHTIVAANGNESLTSVLDGLSGRTARARVWRGLIEADAAATTLAEHQAIFDALAAGDAELARATALVHVSTSAKWLARVIRRDEALANDDGHGPAPADPPSHRSRG
jgi:GntR family transcriptional regulator, transcriptional repressor for pyruvate dehydrogenase complex